MRRALAVEPAFPTSLSSLRSFGPALDVNGHWAIFLRQDTDTSNLVTTQNTITGNSASSYYGILSVGADELQSYWAPRDNTFTNNDVTGSNWGCAETSLRDNGRPTRHLVGQHCKGTPDTGPDYF